MRPRRAIITAGLALALACAPAVASTAFAEPDDSAAAYDKADFYEESPAAAATRSASSASSSNLSSVYVSEEMKYFTKYESHGNYRQGFSYGDGYNALGYYQFDRRYSLIDFMTAVYNYDPVKYAMFKDVLARAGEVSSSAVPMYDYSAGKLTALGQLVQDAWYAAYDADPAGFSALQDSYAYNSYYVPTERWLASQGIDMSGRADCVKGMVWGLSNMWGTGGVRGVLLAANLSNDMTDREFVTALAREMIDNIRNHSSQTEYYKGWADRYRNELADCLKYIAEDEAAAEVQPDPEPEQPGDTTTPDSGDQGSTDQDDAVIDTPEDEGSGTPGDDAQQGAGDGSVTDEPEADSGSGDEAPGDVIDEPADDEAGDAGDTSGDGSDSDNVNDTTPKPSPAPPAANGGITNDVPSEDDENAGSGDKTESDDAIDDAGKDDVTTESETGDKGEQTEDEDQADGKTDETSTDPKDTDDSAARTSGDSGVATADAHPNGVMPQTSDLIMLTTFASASAACFGATFVYAGKRRLKKGDAERGEQDE